MNDDLSGSYEVEQPLQSMQIVAGTGGTAWRVVAEIFQCSSAARGGFHLQATGVGRVGRAGTVSEWEALASLALWHANRDGSTGTRDPGKHHRVNRDIAEGTLESGGRCPSPRFTAAHEKSYHSVEADEHRGFG